MHRPPLSSAMYIPVIQYQFCRRLLNSARTLILSCNTLNINVDFIRPFESIASTCLTAGEQPRSSGESTGGKRRKD